MRKKFLKNLLVLPAIALLAAGCAAAGPAKKDPGLDDSNLEQSRVPASSGPNTGVEQPAGAKQPPAIILRSDTPPPAAFQSSPAATSPTGTAAQIGFTPTVQNSGKPDYRPGYIIVSQAVQASNLNNAYNQVKSGTNAYDLLNSTHTVKAEDYGPGMGEFVQSIDGTAPDGKHFWAFYVNGQSSNLGASNYVLKDGDVVEWKLEAIDNSKS